MSLQHTLMSPGATGVAEKSPRGLLIINADDWGGWKSATDAALECFEVGRITSVTAMVFMEDSERAAKLAREAGMAVGLHLNLNQAFTGECPPATRKAHDKVRRFLRCSKYAQLVYDPWLRREFRLVYESQLQEFYRLFGCAPSHIDGHQHMHLCANVLRDHLIADGESVRRSFSFKGGEKSWFNRWYRARVDEKLRRRYRITDYFFSLKQCLEKDSVAQVVNLATRHGVELMTHPENQDEYRFLLSDAWKMLKESVRACSYKDFRNQVQTDNDQN